VEDEYVTVSKSKLQELRQAMDEYRLVIEKMKKDLEKMKRFRYEGC
jgi:uncharacterized membrane protein (DUF106 family)